MHFTRSRSTVYLYIFLCLLVSHLTASCTCGDDENTDADQATNERAVEGSAAEDIEAVRARVERLIESEHFDEAVATAERSADPELEPLIDRANSERRARELLEEACLDINGEDLAAVHRACNEIETRSRYREKGCCSGAAARYGEDRLEAALDQAEIEGYEQATKSALAIADDPTMPEYIRNQAKAVADDLTNLPEEEADGGGRGGGGRWSRRSRSGSNRSGGGDENLSLAQESFSAGAIRQARTALRQGNTGGCISALRGAPRSAGVVSLLITCYARAGDMGSACNVASRNPNVDYAQRFRARRCR